MAPIVRAQMELFGEDDQSGTKHTCFIKEKGKESVKPKHGVLGMVKNKPMRLSAKVARKCNLPRSGPSICSFQLARHARTLLRILRRSLLHRIASFTLFTKDGSDQLPRCGVRCLNSCL